MDTPVEPVVRGPALWVSIRPLTAQRFQARKELQQEVTEQLGVCQESLVFMGWNYK